MIQKNITLRKTLTIQRFRNFMFNFFNKTKFDSNYLRIIIKVHFFKNVNKKFTKEIINLGTQRILDVTNKNKVKSYIYYVTDEITVLLENNKVKPKDKIIISYFYLDEDAYKNHHKKIVEEHLKILDKKIILSPFC